MQISWIDPEEIKRLVAQLAGPEHLPENTVWELHTQPIATPVATPHGRLLDSTDTPASTSGTVLRSSQPKVEPGSEPQNAELWRIRERLRQLRVKAQQTGIISTTPQPTEPKTEIPVAAQPPIEAKLEVEQAPTNFELPPVETVAWATRDDLPKLNPEPEPPTETNELEARPAQSPETTVPTVSAQRLESLGPMLAEAAAALAAHAKHQAQRIALNQPTVQGNSEPLSFAPPQAPSEVSPFREATPVAEEEKQVTPEPTSQVESITVPPEAGARDGEQIPPTATETSEASATRLTLRNPRANSFESARPSSIGASPLSLRMASHLVAQNRQPLQAESEPLSIVEPASQPTGNKPDSAAEVEPLFGPLTSPALKRSEPFVEAPATFFAQQPSRSPSAQVAEVPSPPINSLSISENAKLESKVEAPLFRLVDLAKESSAEEVHTPSANQAPESSPTAPSSMEAFAVASLNPVAQTPSDSLPAELTKSHEPTLPVVESSTPTLPPLLPFRVPSLGLSERLAALADWACKGLATDEILLVDDYGDVLWGGQGQTALVLSAMMAWHTSQRSAPVSAVAQQKRIDKPLACGRQLTVIPARTRYGVVSLAAIRDKSISDLDANRIHDALIMSVEATGLA